jgi:hypothetical protein
LHPPRASLPLLQMVGSRLGVLWNVRGMSCPFDLECTEEGTWSRKAIPNSGALARSLPHKGLEPGWEWAMEGPWRQCSRGRITHERLGCGVAVGPEPLGAWRVLRQLLPGQWLWQLSQPSRKKLEGGGPVLVGRCVLPLDPGEARHVWRGPSGDLSTPGLGGSVPPS